MKGLAPDTQDETGRTSLHQAAVAGDAEGVNRLLSGGANPNTQDAHLQTPVTLAAERGLYGVVKILAEHSATDINLQDSFGRTPLHWCAKRCDVKGLQALLGTGKAQVNTKTTGGDTALHWACSAEGRDASAELENFEERSLRSAEVLIGAGADVRARNDRDERAQDLASGGAVVALLLSATEELHNKQEAEEADETERKRVAAAATKLSSAAAGPTALSSKGAAAAGTAAAWPEKQPKVGLAFSKQGSGGVVGAKKKMVIKLKKKP